MNPFIRLITPRHLAATAPLSSEIVRSDSIQSKWAWDDASAICYQRPLPRKNMYRRFVIHMNFFLFCHVYHPNVILAFSNDVLSGRHENNGLIWTKICDEILFLREHTLLDKRNIDYLLSIRGISSKEMVELCVTLWIVTC